MAESARPRSGLDRKPVVQLITNGTLVMDTKQTQTALADVVLDRTGTPRRCGCSWVASVVGSRNESDSPDAQTKAWPGLSPKAKGCENLVEDLR
jgi:hypothetical protein